MVEQAGMAPLRVCIFSPEEALRSKLGTYAEQSGYRVEQNFTDTSALAEFVCSASVDHIVLIDVREQVEHRLRTIREISDKRPLAIIGVGHENNQGLGQPLVEAGAVFLLSCPIRVHDVRGALGIAVHQHARQLRLENEIINLRGKLEERKLIERAKGILMDSAKVTESEAFRLIQRQSQDTRKRMSEIATQIISAAELVRQARAGLA